MDQRTSRHSWAILAGLLLIAAAGACSPAPARPSAAPGQGQGGAVNPAMLVTIDPNSPGGLVIQQMEARDNATAAAAVQAEVDRQVAAATANAAATREAREFAATEQSAYATATQVAWAFQVTAAADALLAAQAADAATVQARQTAQAGDVLATRAALDLAGTAQANIFAGQRAQDDLASDRAETARSARMSDMLMLIGLGMVGSPGTELEFAL